MQATPSPTTSGMEEAWTQPLGGLTLFSASHAHTLTLCMRRQTKRHTANVAIVSLFTSLFPHMSPGNEAIYCYSMQALPIAD